jgi:hypothetical protein
MRRLPSRGLLAAMAVASAAALSACGGGGGGGDESPPPVSDTVPDSALDSWVSYTKYAGSLPSDEEKEPLKLDKLGQAPATDSDEPMGL